MMAFDVERRTLLRNALLLVGATSIPIDSELLAAVAKGGGKGFLPKASFATLSAIADTIIPKTDTPGAVGVGVPRLLDSLLANWASAKRRVQLTGAIAAVEAAAVASDKKGFAALTPARRKAVLLDFDKAALKPGPARTEKLNAFEAMMAGPPVANPAWVKLKELVINLYYNSEVGATKELVYEHVPGKFVASFKATPETRPWSSAGPF